MTDEVKKLLCKHFGISPAATHLRVAQKRGFSRFLSSKTHYHFTLVTDAAEFQAFGKAIPNTDPPQCHSVYGILTPDPSTESENLRRLAELTDQETAPFPHLIGLVPAQPCSFLLLESLDGYSNLSTVMVAFALPRRGRLDQIITIGKRVLDRWASWQCDLSASDAFPVDVECSALLDRLGQVRSLSAETKRRLSAIISERAGEPILGRRGVIHADFGPRNILLTRSEVAFIDWEAMQRDRYSLYDPCYFVLSLLLRSLQILLTYRQLQKMSEALFSHLTVLEQQFAATPETRGVQDAVWLGKQLAQVHLLYRYERSLDAGSLHSLLRRRRRQVQYLVELISQDARQ